MKTATGKTNNGMNSQLAVGLPGERELWAGGSPARATVCYAARVGLTLAPLVLVLAVRANLDGHSTPAALVVGTWLVIVGITTALSGLLVSKRRYVVTDQRVIIRHGILSVTTDTIDLDKIVHISIRRSLLQRILGLSSVHMALPGVIVLGQQGVQTQLALSDIAAGSGAAGILVNTWLPRDNAA